MNQLNELLTKYSDNKLVIAIASAFIGIFLSSYLPKLTATVLALLRAIISRFGGRISFKALQGYYLNWIVTEQRALKLTGIVNADDAKKPTLEQVFVSLGVTPKQPTDHTGESGNKDSLGTPLIKTWDELHELLQLHFEVTQDDTLLTRLKHTKKLYVSNTIPWASGISDEGGVPASEEKMVHAWIRNEGARFNLRDTYGDFQLRKVLRENEKIAILGAPGAGKTTLLQYIALTFARERAADPKFRERGLLKRRIGTQKWRLPIVIRLSSIASRLVIDDEATSGKALIDLIPFTLPPDLQNKPGLANFFIWNLRRGKCLVLLDGLDEVPTDREFSAVVTAIESMTVMFPDNQFIVTSRIAGWRSGVGADFKTYYVEDLTKTQTSRFIDIWYDAVEKNSVIGSLKDESSNEKISRERRSKKHASELKLALEENLGIRRLAVNPMLLSIIALVHRSLATLPKERSKLYSHCTHILLDQWDFSRGVRRDDTNLKVEQKEAIMQRLAYRYHTGAIGDKEGGREAPFDQVKSIVSEMLPNLGKDADSANHLLKMLIERSGVLIERRRSVLGFSHHTFQEYFTARELAASSSSASIKFLVDPVRMKSDWWREVILLYAGLISDTTPLIRAIYKPEIDNGFGHLLRLAALCIDEAVEVKDVALRTEIADKVRNVRLLGNSQNVKKSLHSEEIDYLVQWAKGAQWQRFAIMASLRSENSQLIRSYVEDVRSALLSERDAANLMAAVEAVSAFPPEYFSVDLIDNLLSKMLSADSLLRRAIVGTLRSLALQYPGNSNVEQAIVNALSDDDQDVRGVAVAALKDIGPLTNVTQKSYEEAISKNKLSSINHNHLARSFDQVFDGKAPKALCDLARNDRDFVRSGGVYALLSYSDREYLEASFVEPILQLVESSKGSSAEVEILGSLGDVSMCDRVVDALVKSLCNEEKGIALSAAEALGSIGRHDVKLIIKSLANNLESLPASVNELIFLILLQLPETTDDSVVSDFVMERAGHARGRERVLAICALSMLNGVSGNEKNRILLEELLNDSKSEVRAAAVFVLGRWHANTCKTNLIKVMLERLADSNEMIHLAAAAAIVDIGIAETEQEEIVKIVQMFEAVRERYLRCRDMPSYQRIFSRGKLLRRHKSLLLAHAVMLKVGESSGDERIFDSLIKFYANDRLYLEYGIYSQRPSKLFVQVLLHEMGCIDGLMEDFGALLWVNNRNLRGPFLIHGLATKNFDVIFSFRPVFNKSLSADTNFHTILGNLFKNERQLTKYIQKLLNHQMQHMQLLGCWMMKAAGTKVQMRELQEAVVGVLESKRPRVVLEMLRTMKDSKLENFDSRLTASIRRHLLNDEQDIRESAWEILHSTPVASVDKVADCIDTSPAIA